MYHYDTLFYDSLLKKVKKEKKKSKELKKEYKSNIERRLLCVDLYKERENKCYIIKK